MDQIMRIPFKVTTATSNFMIGVTAAASVGIYLKNGYLDPVLVFPVAVGVLGGAFVGARLLRVLPGAPAEDGLRGGRDRHRHPNDRKRPEMREERLRLFMSRLMIWGTLLAALVMIAGGAVFLATMPARVRGITNSPASLATLRHPVAIIKNALLGNDDCLIQVGVLLLLFNPLVRVAMAALGYAASKDRLYAGVAALVLGSALDQLLRLAA